MIGCGYVVLRDEVEPEREHLTDEEIEYIQRIHEARIIKSLYDERDQIIN